MAAKIITVFNQKGGAGKTTVSCNIAGTLGMMGHKTALVDLDEQGTASISASMASSEQPFPALTVSMANHKQPHNEIRKLVEDYEFIVIDCPPAIKSAAPSAALLVSDLGIIPVGGSGGNLWAIGKAIELGKQAQQTNQDLKLRTLANMDQNITIVREVFEQAASQDPDVPMFKTRLGLRAAYKEAEVTGQVVGMFAGKRSAATREVASLVAEIIETLNG